MARDFPNSFAPEPVDRVAGRVISSGYHHEFQKVESCREVWDIPPETVPLFQVPEVIKVLFGQRKGSLLVVGYLGRHKSERGNKGEQRLLVRCDCGKYEVRGARRWRRHDGFQNHCQFCDQREKLKVSYFPKDEKDRLRNLSRLRAGLQSEAERQAQADKRRKEHTEQLLASLLKSQLGRV